MEKVYDNIFKTMVTKNSNLLIPLINEIFGEHYDQKARVILLSDEHQTEKPESEDDSEIITDSYISIDNTNYHLECQSNPDGTIAFRMVEYDFHIALDDALGKGIRRITFPRSAVLYLRHNKNTEDKLTLQIDFPNGNSADYDVKIVKAKNISKDEIIRKKLYFLVPYYIMRVEDEPLQQVLDDYIELLYAIEADRRNGLLLQYDLSTIRKCTNKLVDVVYSSDDAIREGVEKAMGGTVIYNEIDKAFDEGVAKGLEQGLEQGKEQGLHALVSSLKSFFSDFDDLYDAVISNEIYSNVSREEVRKSLG